MAVYRLIEARHLRLETRKRLGKGCVRVQALRVPDLARRGSNAKADSQSGPAQPLIRAHISWRR